MGDDLAWDTGRMRDTPSMVMHDQGLGQPLILPLAHGAVCTASGLRRRASMHPIYGLPRRVARARVGL